MDLLELVAELKKLHFEAEVLKGIVSEIDRDVEDTRIRIGSRVLIKWEIGDETKGRVVGIRKSDRAFKVLRDGFKTTIGLGIASPDLTKHTLENLSTGVYGKLDQRLWLTQNKILEIQSLIKGLLALNDSQINQLFDSLSV